MSESLITCLKFFFSSDDFDSNDMDVDMEDDKLQFLKRQAFWILKMKEKRNLTQSTLEEILSDVTELCKDLIGCLGLKVCKVCYNNNIIHVLACYSTLNNLI